MLLYNFVPNCRNESVVLSEFGKLDTARFCLAHLYTNRWVGTNVVDPWHFGTGMEIRTRESVPLVYGSGSCFFNQWRTRCQVFLLIISSQGFSYFFCLMMEGSGSVQNNNGSGSGSSRNKRIHNTGGHSGFPKLIWRECVSAISSFHRIAELGNKDVLINLVDHLAKRFHHYRYNVLGVFFFLIGPRRLIFDTNKKKNKSEFVNLD